jgi:hypothetical protein
MAKTPPHATGLHSARASETRSPISCCAARILSAEARRRPRTSLSFDSYALLHLAAQVLYEGGLDGLLRSFSKPFIGTAPPDCRFSLFSPSPATSSPLAVWAEEIGSAFIAWLTSPPRCLFIIKRLAGKGHWQIGRWLFFPLASLQLGRYQATVYEASSRASHNVNLNNGSECAVTARLHTTKRVGRRSLPASLPIPLVDVEERNGSAPDYSGQIRAKF